LITVPPAQAAASVTAAYIAGPGRPEVAAPSIARSAELEIADIQSDPVRRARQAIFGSLSSPDKVDESANNRSIESCVEGDLLALISFGR
jgi:hypothetical protein